MVAPTHLLTPLPPPNTHKYPPPDPTPPHPTGTAEVGEAESHDNLVIEVQDLSAAVGGLNPNALSVLLYHDGYIPEDRQTEHSSTTASGDGLYSVAVSAHDIHQGTYFVSIRAETDVTVPFRMVVLKVHAELTVGVTQHGELCPNEWLYHTFSHGASAGSGSDDSNRRRLGSSYYGSSYGTSYYGAADDDDDDGGHGTASGTHLRLKLYKYSGDFYYLPAHEHAPIKLVPPYGYLGAEAGVMEEAEIHLCNLETGTHYLGLVGGSACSAYDIVAETFTDADAECHELNHHAHHEATEGVSALVFDHFSYGRCSPGEWVDFYVNVSEADLSANLVFEIIDRAAPGVNDPHALRVSLFEPSLVAASASHSEPAAAGVPIDRNTEIFSDYAGGGDGIFSLTVSAHRLPTAGPLFLGVQCTTESRDVSFRAVVMRVESELALGHKQHGEVCPGGWVYFHYAVDPADVGRDLVFTVEKYEGDFSAKFQHEYAPVRLIYPYSVVAEEDEFVTLHACDVEANDHLYVGVKGGEHCAVFDILAHFANETATGGACNEEEGAYHGGSSAHTLNETDGTISAVLDLFALVPDVVVVEDNIFQYGSCLPNAWAPLMQFALVDTTVDAAAADDDGHRRRRTTATDGDQLWDMVTEHVSTNMVIEVENLADYNDPEALSVAVWPATAFDGVSTLDGAVVNGVATDNVIAVGMNYIDLKYADADYRTLNYVIGVRCERPATARFRVLAHQFNADLHGKGGARVPPRACVRARVCVCSWLDELSNSPLNQCIPNFTSRAPPVG